MKFFFKDEKNYGKYPCDVYLNNALRFLCRENNKRAASEICYCIHAAGGELRDDVKQLLVEKGWFPFNGQR